MYKFEDQFRLKGIRLRESRGRGTPVCMSKANGIKVSKKFYCSMHLLSMANLQTPQVLHTAPIITNFRSGEERQSRSNESKRTS